MSFGNSDQSGSPSGHQHWLDIGNSFEFAPGRLASDLSTVSAGYWSARSPEFLQTHLMQTLRWMRMVGDTVFAVGAISFVYFALDLIVRQRGARVAVPTDVAVEPV